MLFNILALISTLTTIILLRKLISIFPSLIACIIRWKENINIHNSLRLRNDRNTLALSMILPFCLCIYRYEIYNPAYFQEATENVRLGLIIGTFFLYLIFRNLIRIMVSPKKKNFNNTYKAASFCSVTFFIILTLAYVATGGIISALGISTESAHTAMLWITGGVYILLMLRKLQILFSSYSLFASFLYLCALEILPTGVLIASAVIF